MPAAHHLRNVQPAVREVLARRRVAAPEPIRLPGRNPTAHRRGVFLAFSLRSHQSEFDRLARVDCSFLTRHGLARYFLEGLESLARAVCECDHGCQRPSLVLTTVPVEGFVCLRSIMA